MPIESPRESIISSPGATCSTVAPSLLTGEVALKGARKERGVASYS